MSSETTTKWVCDSCGTHRVCDGLSLPDGWFEWILAPYNSQNVKRPHLCAHCHKFFFEHNKYTLKEAIAYCYEEGLKYKGK